ncbi:MAG: phytanoyl-CoA dioxygenase family protein [Gammaproteobacteria bacterium]|nr:phytanoyl-CoA dioxygenase family protein [Gammaproteobacteria bacterium]
MLSREQIDAFWRDGYLVAERAVSDAQLAALGRDIERWVEESRAHREPFGPPTVDDRPRFDLAAEHSAEHPALRRVNNPSEVSDAFLDVVTGAPMVDMVCDLIGPHVKFHHCKVNLKLPGSQTQVGYHQDFAYTPHTNDDIVTALLMLDDMTEDNGCLKVVPGSHRGPMHSLFDGDRFTGFLAPEVERELRRNEVSVTGRAGDVCLMHTRLVHGSAANRSPSPRGLYICVYTAADAFPIARNPMPNRHEGRIVRGRSTRTARLASLEVELPEQPKRASFFAVQEEAAKR